MHRYLHDMKHSNIIPTLDYFYSLFGNSLSLFLLCNINMTGRIIFGLRNQILPFWRYNHCSDNLVYCWRYLQYLVPCHPEVVQRMLSSYRLSALCILSTRVYIVGSQHNTYQCIFFFIHLNYHLYS